MGHPINMKNIAARSLLWAGLVVPGFAHNTTKSPPLQYLCLLRLNLTPATSS